MDSQTCRALQIVLNVHEVEESQKYRRMYEEDVTWQRNFEFVFTEINKRFATTNESVATFRCGDFELGALGGHDPAHEDFRTLLCMVNVHQTVRRRYRTRSNHRRMEVEC